jgi:SsrA-binding protein
MARHSVHQTEPNKPKNVKRDPIASGERDATVNRAASHNYFLEDRTEAGIVLSGSEVKSVRAGRRTSKMLMRL